MILSYQIPAVVKWREAAIALYDVEREIEQRTRSRHHVDQVILPRLIAKRERLLVEVTPLKIAADAAEAEALRRYYATPANDTPAKPYVPPADGDDGLDIPEFLRRQAT